MWAKSFIRFFYSCIENRVQKSFSLHIILFDLYSYFYFRFFDFFSLDCCCCSIWFQRTNKKFASTSIWFVCVRVCVCADFCVCNLCSRMCVQMQKFSHFNFERKIGCELIFFQWDTKEKNLNRKRKQASHKQKKIIIQNAQQNVVVARASSMKFNSI